jgi:hypothetical protein
MTLLHGLRYVGPLVIASARALMVERSFDVMTLYVKNGTSPHRATISRAPISLLWRMMGVKCRRRYVVIRIRHQQLGRLRMGAKVLRDILLIAATNASTAPLS